MTLDADAQALVARCLAELGDPAGLQDPPGYWHSSLCVLDAIWSMGVRYSSVRNVVARYCSHVGISNPDIRSGPGTLEHTIADFVTVIEKQGPEEFADHVVGNRQRTSTRGGILKAEACASAAHALLQLGVSDRHAILARSNDDAVRRAWVAVPGQRSGISWQYFLMNSGVDHVKPDRMIRGFVARAIGRRVSSEEADRLVRATCRELQRMAPPLTLRALDHAIWRQQSGRNRGGS